MLRQGAASPCTSPHIPAPPLRVLRSPAASGDTTSAAAGRCVALHPLPHLPATLSVLPSPAASGDTTSAAAGRCVAPLLSPHPSVALSVPRQGAPSPCIRVPPSPAASGGTTSAAAGRCVALHLFPPCPLFLPSPQKKTRRHYCHRAFLRGYITHLLTIIYSLHLILHRLGGGS